MTNGDKVRQMSDEELAKLIRRGVKGCDDCPAHAGCWENGIPTCSGSICAWLKQEAKGEKMTDDSLKFRVWESVQKCYVCPETLNLNQQGELCLADCGYTISSKATHYTVERCTGMKDRNGKLIYENDRFKNGGLFWWVVWFRYGWYATTVNGYGSQGWARLEDFDSITILGTIHDDKGEKC